MARAIPDPRGRTFAVVAAGRGLDWWRQAWRWMWAPGNAGVWIGMGLATFVIGCALDSLLPRIGWLLSTVLEFILGGGMMLAARKSAAGAAPIFADLFAGFQARVGPLALAGLIVGAAGAIGIVVLLSVGIGAGIGFFAGDFAGFDSVGAGFGITSILCVIALLVLMLVISLASWLTPALIALAGVDAMPALRESLKAAWANGAALTVYGLVFVGAAIAASIPFGLGWLILLPLTALSTYAAFADVFASTGPT